MAKVEEEEDEEEEEERMYLVVKNDEEDLRCHVLKRRKKTIYGSRCHAGARKTFTLRSAIFFSFCSFFFFSPFVSRGNGEEF